MSLEGKKHKRKKPALDGRLKRELGRWEREDGIWRPTTTL